MNYLQSLFRNISKYKQKVIAIFTKKNINISDNIPSNPKINYIANLVKLAFADKYLHKAEIAFLYKIAKRLELDNSLVDAFIKHSPDKDYDLPKDEITRYSFINDILNLISVDGNIDDTEVLAIKEIAEKLKFDQAVVDDIISKIKSHLKDGFDKNTINDIIQSGIHPSILKSYKYENLIYNALTQSGLNFKHFEEKNQIFFKMGLTLENGRAISIIDVQDSINKVFIYILCLSSVPPHKREMVSEFITLANDILDFGNFEMDHSEGEVRYKCSYTYTNEFLEGDDVFKKNFLTSCNIMDRYLPGLMAIIYSKVMPSDAIAQIDNFTNQENDDHCIFFNENSFQKTIGI